MPATGDERPHCDYCGDLGWTVENWGRVTHKRGCPHRTDPWHQADPAGIISEVVSDDPLAMFVDATGDVLQRKAAGTLGDRVEARCADCGWHAWTYTAYTNVSDDEAREYLLAQHDCAGG